MRVEAQFEASCERLIRSAARRFTVGVTGFEPATSSSRTPRGRASERRLSGRQGDRPRSHSPRRGRVAVLRCCTDLLVRRPSRRFEPLLGFRRIRGEAHPRCSPQASRRTSGPTGSHALHLQRLLTGVPVSTTTGCRVVPVMISTRDHDQSVSSNADVGDGGLCAAPDLDRESSNTPCWTVGVKATSYSASSLCLIATEPRVGHRTGDQHPAVHFLATGGEVPASSLSC